MQSAILLIIATVCFVPSVMSLNCYNCSSVTSWDDCKKEKVTCPAGSDTCVKVSVHYDSKKKFEMYCGKQEQCDTNNNPTCNLGKDAGFSACNLNCNDGVNDGVGNATSTTGTSGDVGNASSTPGTSGGVGNTGSTTGTSGGVGNAGSTPGTSGGVGNTGSTTGTSVDVVNAGSTPGVSGIVMMACAMVVLFLKA